jgi:hypothetical protein
MHNGFSPTLLHPGCTRLPPYEPSPHPHTHPSHPPLTSSPQVYKLLRPEDMRHFKALLRKLDNNVVRRRELSAQELHEQRPALKAALQEVQALLDAEAAGEGMPAPQAAAPEPT